MKIKREREIEREGKEEREREIKISETKNHCKPNFPNV